MVTSGHAWLDMMPMSADKGKGIRVLQKHFLISADACAAFGDNLNDLEMLHEVTYSFAVSNAKEEVKETVLKLSDYTETINQKIKGRLFVLTVIAIIGMIAFVIIEFTGLDTPGSVYERVASAGLGLDCGMLIVLAMYLSGILGKIKARREMKRKYNCK